MGLFQSKGSKEIDLALNFLNQRLMKHYEDWDWKLKRVIGAESASQQPVDGVVKALRLMWLECLARSVYVGIDCKHQFELVTIKTPSITAVLSASEFSQIEFQQATRIVERMKTLVSRISELKPEYLEHLDSLTSEPELSIIQEEARKLVNGALEKGVFDTRNEWFVEKGVKN